MCGRYDLFSNIKSKEAAAILEQIKKAGIDIKTGEIFPTNMAPVFVEDLQVDSMVWGFPNFSSKGVIINARSETVMQKPMFRNSFFNRRCLVLTSGFYEWTKENDKKKYIFNDPQNEVLYLGGIWNIYDGEKRFSILTKNANNSVIKIHDRMPVVIKRDNLEEWISDNDFATDYLQRDMPELVFSEIKKE